MRLRRGQDHIAAALGKRLHPQALPRRHQGSDDRLGVRRAGYVLVPA
jgi:hypothetical protein